MPNSILLSRSPRSGNALFSALLILAVVAAMLAGLLESSIESSTTAIRRVDRFESKRTASSVNRLAAQSFWSGYEAMLPEGREPRVSELRTYLSGVGIVDQAAAANIVPVDVVDRLGLAQDDTGRLVLGTAVVQSVRVHREDQVRATLLFVTTTAIAEDGGEAITQTMTDVFSMSAPAWSGLNFTLLASNINCIMCHTKVDDTRRVYGTGGIADEGEPVKARIGSIESFQIRHDPDSTIAGTLYLGGAAIDEDGNDISDWGAFSLRAAEFDEEGGVAQDPFGLMNMVNLDPGDVGAPVPFQNLYTNYLDQDDPVDGAMPDTFPLPFLDDGGIDPLTHAQGLAGEGNRIIDDLEFSTTTDSFKGSITGGAIGLSPLGNVVTTRGTADSLALGTEASLGAVTAGNVMLTGTPGAPIQIDGRVAIDGDLIISGPIVGEGSLWVRGNIYVRGDLEYGDAIVSGERQYGRGSNGTANALGLTAGGNVVMGDMYRPSWGEGSAVDGTSSGSWNFTLEQAAIFNRREWVKTQPELPGKAVRTATGTKVTRRQLFQRVDRTYMKDIKERRDTGRTTTVPVMANVQVGTREEPIYEWVTVPPTKPPPYGQATTIRVDTGRTREVPVYERQQVGTRENPIMEWVVTGQREVTVTDSVPFSPARYEDVETTIYEMVAPLYANADYMGDSYVARYYGFGEGDPVPIPNADGYFDPDKDHWVAPERVEGWNENGLTLADPNDPNDPFLYPDGKPTPVITTLEPTASWMDKSVLRELITDSLDARDADEPFKVDATVYSANSIFGVVPNSPSEGTNGKLRVNGALLAADIGLLGPSGTEINYDPRGRDVLEILDENELTLRLVGTLPAPLQ